jgi:hypothetical protein
LYNPNNIYVYMAAYSGALSGMGASPLGSQKGSVVKTDYTNAAESAGAFAQEFDTQWGLVASTILDEEAIWSCCAQAIANRTPLAGNDSDNNPAAWVAIAQSIIALVQQGDAFVAGQGISPPSGDGGISSISVTAPIHSSGGEAPVISIVPATDLVAGSMSATDKAKLDALSPVGSGVSAVTGTAPIVSSGGATPALSITPATELQAGSMSAADKAKLDAVGPSSGFLWSPVSIIKAVNQQGPDTILPGSQGLTGATTFYIYDPLVQRYATGVRFLWCGPATNIKVSIWLYTSTGAGHVVATKTIAVAAALQTAPGDYSVMFDAPLPLIQGFFYAASFWDTANASTVYTSSPPGADGILAQMFTTSLYNSQSGRASSTSIIASPFHAYAVVYGNGGGLAAGPFCIYGNAIGGTDTLPENIGGGFFPVEPILA